MQPLATQIEPFFPPIKKLVQYTVSFYKDISLPSHSERNLNNLPNFSTMCLRDTSLKTGIGHNEMTIAECNIVVTVLRLIATNSLSIKWLQLNYIEHWSNNKIENSSWEFISFNVETNLYILCIIFCRSVPFLYWNLMAIKFRYFSKLLHE